MKMLPRYQVATILYVLLMMCTPFLCAVIDGYAAFHSPRQCAAECSAILWWCLKTPYTVCMSTAEESDDITQIIALPHR